MKCNYIIGAEVRKYVGCSLYCQHKSKKNSKQNPGTPFFVGLVGSVFILCEQIFNDDLI